MRRVEGKIYVDVYTNIEQIMRRQLENVFYFKYSQQMRIGRLMVIISEIDNNNWDFK